MDDNPYVHATTQSPPPWKDPVVIGIIGTVVAIVLGVT